MLAVECPLTYLCLCVKRCAVWTAGYMDAVTKDSVFACLAGVVSVAIFYPATHAVLSMASVRTALVSAPKAGMVATAP